MHLAVGTSLANIVPISIISAINHHRRGSVNLDFLKFIFLSLLIGVIFGSIAVSFLEGSSLILIYSIILFFVALQFFFGKMNGDLQINFKQFKRSWLWINNWFFICNNRCWWRLNKYTHLKTL